MKTSSSATASAALGEVVTTADGSLTMSHPEHGECYHSQSGAMAEARLLYVESSGLASLWRQGPAAVGVLDVGLGLGLNAIATLTAWAEAEAPGPLAIHSLEINPELVIALASGQAPWQANWRPEQIAFCRTLQFRSEHYFQATIAHPHSHAAATWQIFIADAATSGVPQAPVDHASGYTHIWQDPFSPEKNPPMWESTWFRKLLPTAAPGCVLMTYSVAGPVRRALAAGGWTWRKLPALLPGKREWLTAQPAKTPT